MSERRNASRGYKLENGLSRLLGRVDQKRCQGEWDERYVVHESNAAYGADLDA